MLLNFYTHEDIKSKYEDLKREQAQVSVKWLQTMYPRIVGVQLVAASLLYTAFDSPLVFSSSDPLGFIASVALLSMVLVAWPIILMPVNRARKPTLEEAEMLIIARFYKDAVSLGIDKEEVIKLVEQHRMLLREGGNKLDC